VSSRATTTAILLAAWMTAATAQVPSTDIFIVPVDGEDVGEPRRVTDREGYDNQPQFLPDGRSLVYASQRGESTDIFRFDLDSGEELAVAKTPESEYSPTPIPGRKALSVVRDYGDLDQQLWSFPLDGGDPQLLLPDVNPVGYHAWIDRESLILFVLGEPHTLQVAKVGPGPGKVLADSPGRALARMPGSGEMSFVDKSGDEWWLTAIDPASGERRRLIAMPEGREDYAWAPDGAAWAGGESRLYRWHPAHEGWRLVADLGRHGIRGITRLAFSPDGGTLALVAARE
jgi:Tol biopolymer transport system component